MKFEATKGAALDNLMNIGIEFFGFCLLLISAILIGVWAYRGGHRGILFLQFFYATAAIIGMFRWF